jgi:hypothetical protein
VPLGGLFLPFLHQARFRGAKMACPCCPSVFLKPGFWTFLGSKEPGLSSKEPGRTFRQKTAFLGFLKNPPFSGKFVNYYTPHTKKNKKNKKK